MSSIENLLSIMAQLRDPNGGCAWDLEQTFASIAPYTIEEAYEVADAIEQNDMQQLKSELGDLLLQVVFHSQMAAEAGHFTFDDVVTAISDKMIKRHPHVFGDAAARSTADQLQDWEQQKEQERESIGARSALDDVTRALPAMTRAIKLQKRAARVGFEWPSLQTVVDKLDEEVTEFKAELQAPKINDAKVEDELGDLFFVLTNLARTLKLDPEDVLKQANQKFERRFRAMEKFLEDGGRQIKNCNLDEMIFAWVAIKKDEAKPS